MGNDFKIADDLIQIHISLCLLMLDIEARGDEENVLYWLRLKAQTSHLLSVLKELKETNRLRTSSDLDDCIRLFNKATHKKSMAEAF